MMDYTYWQKQTASKPLFPEVEWNRPEQRRLAGRLAIVGGNKLGFAGVAESYSHANHLGVGQLRVLLPDALKKTIPKNLTDTVFGATTVSGGGLSKQALTELKALAEWSTGVLMIGDAGRNSETAVLYERFIADYTGPLTITRDAFDLIKESATALASRENTLLVISFAQSQKLFQTLYYPKMLTFNMQLLQLVEALHKFTITYPVALAVFHKNHLIVAHQGRVVSQEWPNPMSIWRGLTATEMAAYWLWNPAKPFEAYVTSLASKR